MPKEVLVSHMYQDSFDLLIVGAGPVGCVIAERAASVKGWRSLIIDKRRHIAGNCHDYHSGNGVLVHGYGPHYFRTNNQRLLSYLSKFTGWIPGKYIVKSYTNSQYYSFPINLTTLEQFFNVSLNQDTAQSLLADKIIPSAVPANSEEYVLSRVGRELYEAFYLGYTMKNWGLHPKDLAQTVCGRIPVRFNRDERYVDHRYQVMPEQGYTRLFERMIDHEFIHVMLQTDFEEVRGLLKPSIATVYCGPLDEYFGKRYGALGWRSLDFHFESRDVEYAQSCVQINYPNDFDYTRSVEIKHVTGQIHAQTVISYEFPRRNGDPYYPIPSSGGTDLFLKYKRLADEEEIGQGVYFAGRLANYRYMDMDEAMEDGLRTFEKICARQGGLLDALSARRESP